MEVVNVKIEELKPSEYNPRGINEKEKKDLEDSIKKYGIVEPIVVNSAPERKNIIIGGHMRYYIVKEMGWEEIPVVYVNIPDIKKEQELNLRLNKNLGHWDYDLLANFDEEMLKDVGFEAEELDEIFGLEIDDSFDVEKEVEKVLKNKERRCKEGDLWQLGEHKLIIGDCTDRKNWERLLGEERFDFMFTDPPYKLAYTKKKTKGLGTKKIKTKKGFGYKQQRSYLGVEKRGGVPEYDEWLSIANEFQNPKGANVMIFEFWKNTPELWQAIEKYWKIKNLVIWYLPNRRQGFGMKYQFFNKYDVAPLAGEGKLNEDYEKELENFLQEKGQELLNAYEIILYGQQKESYWNRKKGSKWAKITDHITWTAETEASSGQNVVFGTKPIQILVPYIKILSPRGGIVMEPFGGSGSTLIACEIMKRKCRAIEIEPLYAEVILNRWEKISGQKAQKL